MHLLGFAFIIFEDSYSVNKVIDMCSYADHKYLIGIRTYDGGKRVVSSLIKLNAF